MSSFLKMNIQNGIFGRVNITGIFRRYNAETKREIKITEPSKN